MSQTLIQIAYKPRRWQRQCHLGLRRFSVLVLHRRAGKTELAVMELIDAALKATVTLPLYVYVAPFLKQAKAIAWARLKEKLEPARLQNIIEVNESELSVRFVHNGAIIRLFGADNPDALRGMRLDGVVLDEVAQMAPAVWTDILQPALSDRLGWALFIGTVGTVDLFSELYFRAQGLPEWYTALFTVYDTEALDRVEIERLKRDMSATSFAREYLCDFTASGDDQLISLADVEAAAQRAYKPNDMLQAPRILGVDPARFGDDRSVIVRRQGLQMFAPIIMHGIDNMGLASRVAAEIELWLPDAVFIDAGAGAGVIDRLRQLNHSVVEVPFGAKAMQPTLYVNRRTEMWWLMREWLMVGGAIPDERALKQELATPIYWFDAQGRKVLEPKDEIKKRLLGAGSPDIADALALTFAYPVKPKTPLDELGVPVRRQMRDYDPLAQV